MATLSPRTAPRLKTETRDDDRAPPIKASFIPWVSVYYQTLLVLTGDLIIFRYIKVIILYNDTNTGITLALCIYNLYNDIFKTAAKIIGDK